MPEIPMASQLYTGRGLNSATGGVFARGVDFDPVQPEQGGQSIVFILESVTSSEELSQKLSISASASFTAAWGVSAEFALTNSHQINSYYTYALIRCHVINPPKLLRNPRLTKDAWTLLEQQGWNTFAERFGWEYVDGFIEGGSYYALLEFQTTSETDQNYVKVKLSGHYGPFSASGQFESDVKDIQKRTVINVSVTRSGGSGEVVHTDFDGMLNEARNFPATAKANPVAFLALTAEYRQTIPSLPNVPPPNSLPRQQQQNTLNDLGHAYLQLRDYKANVEFVLGRPLTDFDEFRELDPAAIVAKQQEFRRSLQDVGHEIDEIVRRGRNCAADFNQCPTYTPSIQLLNLPRIGGELLNLKQMEEKLAALEKTLLDRGLPGGNLQLAANGVISAPGRLHVGGDELLYLLNRQGVIVARDWQGNGNLYVDGDISVGGRNKNALRGTDSFLRLNQDGAFPNGVHTPGLLSTTGLNVGGVNGWDHHPGPSNAAIGGDLQVLGRIGVNEQPATPHTGGWAGGIHTWDLECEGSAWSANGWEGGPRDIAENYAAETILEPGEVVCLDPERDVIVRSTRPGDQLVCGVISTRAGLLLNADREADTKNLFPVALCGRVACKVVTENGPIDRGDLLTSSSTPGHAMKAETVWVDGKAAYRPGTILGKALEQFKDPAGVIDIMVMSG